MSRLRFKVGDLARVVSIPPEGCLHLLGAIVEVVCVGPFQTGALMVATTGARYRWNGKQPNDYLCRTTSNSYFAANDPHLAPLNGIEEPASLTRGTDLQEPLPA